jgi:GNAT superfamily N-acetyltransferase
MDPTYQLRLATSDDIPALHDLIALSVRGLSVGFYTPTQVESALRHLFGPDSQLVADGTYYVIEAGEQLVAAGGWSRRRTMYGGDQAKRGEDSLLDPAVEAARIRAFFVHPGWARRGLGRRLFEECRTAARAAGFRRLELVATLPGEPLYRTLDFEVAERFSVALPDGVEVPVALMTRPVELPAPPPA